MKKLFLLLLTLLLGISASWAGYIPTKRVTTFESGKKYMIYNTCYDPTSSEANRYRAGFIYIDDNGAMKKKQTWNPKQFSTNSTIYLWKITTGADNHVAIQNVSNGKYYGPALGKNDSDPNTLYLYSWGANTDRQAGCSSQQEDDPSQNTANGDITFADNKVFIIGNDDRTFWNGNPGDIVTWETGHPFAFYEVAEVSDVCDHLWDINAFYWTPEASEIPEGVTTASASAEGETIRGQKGYVEFKSSGDHSFTFQYTSGNKRLDILGVDVLNEAGTVIASDYHAGYTGGNKSNNVYTVNIPSAGDYLLRYFAKTVSSSGNTTNGTITCSPALGTIYFTDKVATGSSNASDLDQFGASQLCVEVASGATLTVDDAFDLTKIHGPGTVVLDADNNSLTGSTNKSTVATGKLTINEGKTLTIGTGDGQAHSIESFTSIDLAGTIKHNNSKATLNNVTVPTGKTGNIFAYDMGNDPNEFKLSGTTTLNGNLNVGNLYNFQMKVDELAGSGTWLICGMNQTTYDPTKTTSNENAYIKVGSSPNFTGTIHEANTKSYLSITGTLKNCTLKGTQAPDGYPQLADGAVLDGVILEGDKRIGTTGSVTIKDLAGNNLSGTSNSYAFIGSGTLNFEGTCDLTKKSDDSESTCIHIGYGSGNNIVIKSGAVVTAGNLWNSSGNNAAIAVEGTITATYFGGAATLAEGSTTTLSDATPFDAAVTVSGDATLNLTASTSAVNKAITVAEGKTLTIDGGSNTVNLTGAVSGSGNIVLSYFPNAATHPNVTDWTGSITFSSPSAAQADIAAIFNVWGNTNSTIKLHSLTGWLPGPVENQTYTVFPTLEILESETLTINNGSSSTTPVLRKVTGAGVLEQTWSGGSNYTLKIATLTDFTGTLKGTKKTIVVENLVLASAPNLNGRLFKTSGTVTFSKPDSKLYIGETEKTAAYAWEDKTVDEVKGYYITESAPAKIADALSLVGSYHNEQLLGNGVGKYTVSIGSDTYTDFVSFGTAVSAMETLAAWEDKEVTVAINQPTAGMFLRFKSKNNNRYAKAVDNTKASGTEQMQTSDGDPTADNIFYFAGSKLLSYSKGLYIVNTRDMASVETDGSTFEFSESDNLGAYFIKCGSNYMYGYNKDHVSEGKLDRINTTSGYEQQCRWYLEEVTSLPVTITAAGYATLCSPVALTIPSGITAYKATEYPTYLSLTSIGTEGEVIPANEGVIIAGSAGTYNFATTTTEETISDNALNGTVAAISRPSGSYILSVDNSGNVGFYKDGPTTIPGFRAYLPAPATVKEFLTFVFDEETNISSIDNGQLTIDNAKIYNLAGQRVSKAQKGLYIVNGKKVLVK